MLITRLTQLALIVAGLAAAGSASAQIKTWNFTDTSNPGLCGQTSVGSTVGTATNIGNVRSCTDQASNAPPYNLAITAFSASNTAAAGSTLSNNNVGGTASNAYAAATVLNHGGTAPDGLGLGVGNVGEGGNNATSTNGNHAMDSRDGRTDMLLLSFTSAQVLRTVTLGWASPDGDFQVLACTVAAFCGASPTIATKTAAGLLSNGWSLISTVDANSGFSPDASFTVNTGLVSSSYWLITAFNSSFGGSVGNTIGDAIKVMGVTAGVSTSVPEPGSLALAGLALAGVFASRRKVKALF